MTFEAKNKAASQPITEPKQQTAEPTPRQFQSTLQQKANASARVAQLARVNQMAANYVQRKQDDFRPVMNVLQRVSSRPSFAGPARKAKLAGHNYTGGVYDYAHKISYHDIQAIVSGGNPHQINGLIDALTIPQRPFGQYPAGYLGYKNTVISITNAGDLIRALNNSPFNLRPGVPSANRSIGAGFDGNVYDDGVETPQTAAIRPHALTFDAQDRTSSYLSDHNLTIWEGHAFTPLNL